MNKLFIFLVVFALALVFLKCNNEEKQNPNVLIIYSDDLGWSDIGCYGNEKNETPNLDKLASEGIRFTNAYAPAPICSASRASIMTGKSPARLHFEFVSTKGHITDRPLLPPKRTLELPLEEITLGEIAKEAGYKAAFFGKWHIAKHNGKYLKWSETHGPFQQGFEIGSDNFGSHPYNKKNRDIVNLPDRTYPQDSLVLMAIDFIKNQKVQKQPFFMFFSSYYVHTPVIPNNSWLIEKYIKQLPNASENEIKYAAFVETMDYYYGQILQALKDYGLEKNTLVIFTSDNGGHPAYTNNHPLNGNKWTLYEGGIREPFIVKWPKFIKGKSNSQLLIIQWDILPTLCDLFKVDTPENIDGESLLPILQGKSKELSRQSIYWHFPYYHPPISYEGTKPCSAIRKGSFKLIYFYEDEKCELYNLETDFEETLDLSIKMPELVNELKTDLMDYLHNVNARFPTLNPEYPNNIDSN